MKQQFEDLLDLLKEPMEFGVTVEIKIKAGTIWVNLHTRAKSDCELECLDSGIIAHRRYGRADKVENSEHLWELVAGCCHGRDFFDCSWAEFLASKGVSLN